MPVLDWIGKKAVVNHHRDVPYCLVNCDKSKSAGDVDAGNLLVQGDNLIALKALLPYYARRVRCIYIDPPYNTGSEAWVYNDNVNSQEIRNWLGRVVGKETEDLSRHDKWLCMMYPRLRLLRDFLTDDGVLLVSIDDNEAAHMRLLLNEIFGARNFVAQLVWEKGRKNDAKLFSIGADYIFVFAKNISTLADIKWRSPKEGVTEIATEYHRLTDLHGSNWELVSAGLAKFYKGLKKGHPSKKYSRAKNADKRGVWRDNNISWHGGGGPKYDIIHPVTNKPCKVPEDGWRFVEESMLRKIADGYVIFRKDHKSPPIYKSYIYLVDPSDVSASPECDGPVSDPNDEDNATTGQSEVLGTVFYRHTQPSNDVLKAIFGSKVFPNPKDHEILARLIRYVTSDDKQAIILDSFAGSGSTGHAVIALNNSDGGSRRFVLLEMEKEIARNITATRLEHVIREPKARAEGERLGFRFCSLGEPLFDAQGNISAAVTFQDLAAHIYFSETGSPIPQRASESSPLLGVHQGRAVFLLCFASIQGKAPSDSILTASALKKLHVPGSFNGPRVVYAEGCTVSADRLAKAGVVFKQVPYQIEGI